MNGTVVGAVVVDMDLSELGKDVRGIKTDDRDVSIFKNVFYVHSNQSFVMAQDNRDVQDSLKIGKSAASGKLFGFYRKGESDKKHGVCQKSELVYLHC